MYFNKGQRPQQWLSMDCVRTTQADFKFVWATLDECMYMSLMIACETLRRKHAAVLTVQSHAQ